MIGVVAGAASIVRKRVKGESFLPIYSTTCLILTLILGYFQFVGQLELQREHFDILGITGSSINFDIGFQLALISVMLWIISLSLDQIIKAKMEPRGKGELNKAGVAVAIAGVVFLIVGLLALFYEYTLYGPIFPYGHSYVVHPYSSFGIAFIGTGVVLIAVGAGISYEENPEQETPKDRGRISNSL